MKSGCLLSELNELRDETKRRGIMEKHTKPTAARVSKDGGGCQGVLKEGRRSGMDARRFALMV